MVIVNISSKENFNLRTARFRGTNLEVLGLFYDGSAMIIINGVVVAQGSQFSLRDVEVVTGMYYNRVSSCPSGLWSLQMSSAFGT